MMYAQRQRSVTMQEAGCPCCREVEREDVEVGVVDGGDFQSGGRSLCSIIDVQSMVAARILNKMALDVTKKSLHIIQGFAESVNINVLVW